MSLPKMVVKLAAIGVLQLVLCGPMHGQELLGYWDLNGTTARSEGTQGTLSAELIILGIGKIGYGVGSEVNLRPGFSAGQALRFFDLVSVAETGHVTVSDLDFTGLLSPTVSFAVRSNPAFSLDDAFRLEYNVGAGWMLAADLPRPGTSYGLVSHTFAPGLLDDHSDVGIRLTFHSIATVLDTVDIDNLTVEAVPEAGAWILITAVAMWVLIARKRPRRA